jgi:hypothetical protein
VRRGWTWRTGTGLIRRTAEAQWFCRRVKRMVRDGMVRKEIALLYRNRPKAG